MNRTWNQIKAEIDNGLVVCAGVDWSGGGKHYVVIWGYEECDDGVRRVFVKDPWYASSTPTFQEFIANYLNKNGKCSELAKIV